MCGRINDFDKHYNKFDELNVENFDNCLAIQFGNSSDIIIFAALKKGKPVC